mgnify:FL=1
MSLAYDAMVAGTAAVGAAAMALAYARSRDPFHPLLLACPMAIFLYACMPLVLAQYDTLVWFVSPEELERAQTVFLVLLAAFCAGALAVSGRTRWSRGRAVVPLTGDARRRLGLAAAVFGAAGLAAWAVLITSGGGLQGVYDTPHGGDVLHPSGWVRESTRLALVGVLLTLAASQSPRAWLLALAFAAPQIVHAALGTRRGPAFVSAVMLVGSLYVFRGQRPRLAATLAGGGAVGVLLLFLLANRDRIYYGSEQPVIVDITDSMAFRPTTGNEYLTAAGFVTTADRTGRFGWGLSYVEQLFVRPIPRAVMPDKYDLIEEGTVTPTDMAAQLGWRPPPGWATTIFAHLYIEFAWLSVLASFLLGAAYAWVWRRSVEQPTVGWQSLYVLMCAGVLHLFAQDFWAMGVPLLLMFTPTWLALRWALDHPFRGRPSPAAAR